MANLRNLVESAWAGYLSASGITANIYKGFASGDKASPAVICKAVSAEETHANSGNWDVQVKISSRASFDYGLTDFDMLCNGVAALVYATDLNTQLIANQSGLMVWGTAADGRMEWDVDEDCWIENLTVSMVCWALFPYRSIAFKS